MQFRNRLYAAITLAQAWIVLVSMGLAAPRADGAPPPAPASAPADEATASANGNEATEAGSENAGFDVPAVDRRFRLDITDLFVGFESDFEHRRVTTTIPMQRDTTYTDHTLRFYETTGLTLSGFAYDPNLLEYSAALEFGLTQDRFKEKETGFPLYSNSENDDGFLMRYDINVDMFKAKPLSLNFYARRDDARVPRQFLPSLREERTETGLSAMLVGTKFTTEAGFSWRDIERYGNRLESDDESLENSQYWIDHKFQFSDTHKLRLMYNHEHDESDYQGSEYSFKTQRDEVRVEHELAFGPGDKHRLDTYFRYNAEKGDLARDELELVPQLTLQHTDKFKTIQRYSLYQYDQGAVKVTQNRFDSEAVWDATDKLRLTADGYAMHERVENDLDTNQFGGLIDASYHQPTSLGELWANAHFGFDQMRTAGDAGDRYVRAEAHAMGGSRPVFLRETGIVPGSIIAYNGTRTRLYIPGKDYIPVVVAGRAIVTRLLTGRIADGEVVYFDYTYKVPAHGQVDSYRSDFLIEHRFNFGLTPYYALEARCQQVENSRATPWYRDNQNRHRFGVRFEKERFNLGAEYEIFYDSVLPYTAGHFTGHASLLNSVAHTLDINGELSRYLYGAEYDYRHVWWLDVNMTDRSRITDYLWFKANTAYHFEDDSVDGDTNGVDVEAGFELKRGYLTMELVVEYDLLSLMQGDDEGVGIYLNLRRDLSHLLPAIQPWRTRGPR